MSWVWIARKEALEIVRSPKFVGTFSICALLVLLAFWVGGRGYLLDQRRWQAGKAESLRQLAGETDWLKVAPTVSLPPQPLTSLVSGVAHDIGRNATISGRGALRPWGSRYGSDPIFAIFRFLDLEFVFRIVLSLFALLFAYDAICGERERGTLRLCFSHPVSRAQFLLGKIVGTAGALLLPLLVPILLGCLVWTTLGISLPPEDWLRLALLIVAGFLYVSCFLAIAVWVSALTRRPAHSFLLLLSLWVVLVLITPRAAVALAARQVEVISSDRIESECGQLRSQLWATDRGEMRADLNRILGGGRLDPDSLTERMKEVNQVIQSRADERERKLAERERSLLEQRRNQQQAQQRLAFTLARISPAATFSLAAGELAGTSLALEEHYRGELLRYQELYGRFQASKSDGRKAGGGVHIQVRLSDDEEEEPAQEESIDPYELPPFQYRPPALAAGLRAALPDLALLAGISLLAFTGSFISFLRYDLR